MSIVTLDEVKRYMKISSPNQDEALTALLEPATEVVEGYLKYKFTSDDVTTPVSEKRTEKFLLNPYQQDYLLDTTDTDVIYVSWSIPYQNIGSSITVQLPEITDEDYFVDQCLGRITFFRTISQRTICEVEYNTAKTPTEGIKLATMMLISYWQEKEFNQTITNQGQSVTRTPVRTLPKHVESILNLYRRT